MPWYDEVHLITLGTLILLERKAMVARDQPEFQAEEMLSSGPQGHMQCEIKDVLCTEGRKLLQSITYITMGNNKWDLVFSSTM